jgi:hypothetical protein
MLADELYDPSDTELVAAREHPRDLCQSLNLTREAQQEDRRRILCTFLARRDCVDDALECFDRPLRERPSGHSVLPTACGGTDVLRRNLLEPLPTASLVGCKDHEIGFPVLACTTITPARSRVARPSEPERL